MTHNIVAEFSSSLDNNGNFKQYQVVAGSVFNGQYNETLDNATIILSQVKKEDRLSYIKPYDFVRVFDKSTYDEDTETYGFDKIYLLDNFTEQENNIEEHIFGYTINLMSETKLLEKIQCPNLSVTHKVNEDGTIEKKTIWEKIKEYMELYIPKMKYSSNGTNWSYEPIIKFPISYVNGTETISFDLSDFVFQTDEYEINVSSDVLDSSIKVNAIEDITFTITSTPTLLWRDTSVSLDKTQRKFKFHGFIQDFPITSGNTGDIFEGQEFVPSNDYPGEWEITVVCGITGDDVMASSVTVISFEVETEQQSMWRTQEVTYDATTKKFTFHGICQSRPDGEISVIYEAKKVSGTVNVSFKTVDETDTFYQRFNVSCADLPFNTPTLRQLLTTLMLQVGCIPVVKNRILSFLDFQLVAQPFGDEDYTINHTVNFIHRALSSDSYVNSLVNISNQVLDSGNEVIVEALGFRDKNNAFIKQTENLYLETKFPIYKVTKCALNAYVNAKIDINDIEASPDWHSINGGDTQWKWNIVFSKSGYNLTVNFNPSYQYNNGSYDLGLVIQGKVVAFKSGTLVPQEFDINDAFYTSTIILGTDGVYHFTLNDNSYDTFYFYGYISVIDPLESYRGLSYSVFRCNYSGNKYILTLYSQDITPLVVEQSVRQNLSTDFLGCTSEGGSANATLETLAKYVYGTVGYNIGATKIEGFSNVYNVGQSSPLGWINKGYTYIENIWNFIVEKYQGSILVSVRDYFGNMPIIQHNVYEFDYDLFEPDLDSGTGIDNTESIELDEAVVVNPTEAYAITGELTVAQFLAFGNTSNFTYLWFDIAYQPLNSFNIAYLKSQESIDYPLEQYDNNASGVTDFDRLSLHEQEQVDRIGNEVLNISQRTINFSDIQNFNNGPLYFMDDTNRSGSVDSGDNGVKYIIFKYSFSIGNNCYNASYTGSKDAVLKDYFTSIRTKYRAYQYVDYSQSTLRKERDTFFVRISENDWYQGDDKIFFGAFRSGNASITRQQRLMTKLLGSWSPRKSANLNASNPGTLNGVADNILASNNTTVKNDVSVVATQNFFALVYEECDNVGSGTYLFADNIITAIQKHDALNGGVPQSWQIWEEDYSLSHIVSYSSFLNLSKTFDDYIDIKNMNTTIATQIETGFQRILDLPKLSIQYLDIKWDNSLILSVVSNNKAIMTDENARKRLFYKDYAERINHTVQFNYYTDSQNIIWTDNFFKLNDIAGYSNHFLDIHLVNLEGQPFELKKEEYRTAIQNLDILYVNGNVISFKDGSENNTNPYIEINWSLIPNITQFKVVATKGYIERHDVIAFKKGDSDIQRFYITLNDTKSDYVMSEKNGILYRRYKVSVNTTARTVVPLYDET